MAIQKAPNTAATTKAKGGSVAAPANAPAPPHPSMAPASMKDTSHLTTTPKRAFGASRPQTAHMMNSDGPMGMKGNGAAGC